MMTPGVSIAWKGSDRGLALAAEVKVVARQAPQMFRNFNGAFQPTQVAALVAVIEQMGEEYLRLWQNSDETARKLYETERRLAAAKSLQGTAEMDKQRYLEERDALQRENENLHDRFNQSSYKEVHRRLQQQQARIQQLTEGMAKLLRDIKDE